MGIIGTIRTLGPATALSYAAARAGSASASVDWHRYRIISVPRTAMPAMPRGHGARLLAAGELAAVPIDVSPAVQRQRFDAGLVCLAAFAGETLVAVNWLARGSHDEDEVRVRYLLPADAAWDTGLWIPPERRLGRAFAAIWAGTAAWLAEAGLQRSMSRIADYNVQSLTAHRRMGGAEVASLACLRVGSAQLALPASPALTTARGETPVLDLRAR
jgi:hypothetical protein